MSTLPPRATIGACTEAAPAASTEAWGEPMEMHQIRYFLAVAELLNFTRAAEACNVAQPSLTKAIKNLEEELGGLLFHREHNRTHLTELGRRVRPHLESVYASTAAARAEAEVYRTMQTAPLRLGVMCTISPSRMVPFFEHVRSRIPSLDMSLREASAVKLVEEMLAGELDVALLALPTYPDRLRARPLFSERYVMAFPKGHRYQSMNSVPLPELDGEDYLQRLHCEFRYHFEGLGVARTWQTNVRYRSEHEEWIQAMILAGMGCSVMPETSTLLPGVMTRLIVEPEVSRTVSLVTVAGRRFTPTERAFMTAVQSYRWDTLGDPQPTTVDLLAEEGEPAASPA